MRSTLCIGVSSKDGQYEIVALEQGKESAALKFPATAVGIQAIRGFLVGCGKRARLAVAGAAALSVALALGDQLGVETFIVSSNSSIANHASALAHYADHTL